MPLGIDIINPLYLMIYMDHASLESTYYSIQLIPDYFPQSSALAASPKDLIPEIAGKYNQKKYE